MVELSRQNGGYSHLYCDDLRSSLGLLASAIQHQQTPAVNLVLSADTFLYVGFLGEIFSLVQSSLSSDGLFIFSTEQLETSPMRLLIHREGLGEARLGETDSSESNAAIEEMRKYEPEGHTNGAQILSSGRFAHSHSYILSLGEKYGFSVVHIEDIIVRTEVNVPLPGKIYVFQRTGGS
jgi:predicted TPR repeat methyltransferase